MKEKNKDLFEACYIQYGKEPQVRQCMEECAELIQALNKYLRHGDKALDNLYQEIADVELCIGQVKNMLGVDVANKEIKKWTKTKVDKMWGRLVSSVEGKIGY